MCTHTHATTHGNWCQVDELLEASGGEATVMAAGGQISLRLPLESRGKGGKDACGELHVSLRLNEPTVSQSGSPGGTRMSTPFEKHLIMAAAERVSESKTSSVGHRSLYGQLAARMSTCMRMLIRDLCVAAGVRAVQ